MKRKTLLYPIVTITLILACFTSCVNAQTFNVGLKYSYVNIDHFRASSVGGLSIEVQFDEFPELYLQYDLLFGDGYVHFPLIAPLGLFGGLVPVEAIQDWSGTSIPIALLAMVVPEGVGYAIPLKKSVILAPYFRPLQLEYRYKALAIEPEENDIFAGGSIGAQLHLLTLSDQIRISPYGEYKFHYHKHLHPGYSFGLTVSKVFKVTE